MGKLDAMDHLKFEHSRGANMMIPASSSTQYPHHDCSSTRCYWEMAIGTRNIPNYCCLTCWWYSHYGWSVAPCWLAYASVYPKIQINEAANNYHTNKSTNHSWSGSVFNEFRLVSFHLQYSLKNWDIPKWVHLKIWYCFIIILPIKKAITGDPNFQWTRSSLLKSSFEKV